jgi:hypothetical protein
MVFGSVKMDKMSTKICTKCKEDKDLDLFGNNRNYKDGKQYSCKKCNTEYMCRKHRVNKYGVSPEMYASMLEAHDHKCAICGKPNSSAPRKQLCVDHCHSTGLIRGLLCGPCNSAIGFLMDRADLADKAAEYLRK